MLTMKYDHATLPSGVLESTLYIAYWDGSQWQALPSTVDTQIGTVSAWLSHFSIWALMGKMTIPTPAQTTVPTPFACDNSTNVYLYASAYKIPSLRHPHDNPVANAGAVCNSNSVKFPGAYQPAGGNF